MTIPILAFLQAVPFLSQHKRQQTCTKSYSPIVAQLSLRPPLDPLTDQWAPENLGFVLVATITSPHGVYGQFRVKTHGDFTNQRLAPDGPLRHLLLPGRRYPRPIQLKSARPATPPYWLVQIEGISQREQAINLRGSKIYVRVDHRPKLGRGEFLVTDLVGCRVSLKTEQLIKSWASWNTRLHGTIHANTPIGIVSSVITREDLCKASGAGKKSAAVANDLLEVACFDIQGEAQMTTSIFCGDIPEDATRSLVPFVKQLVPVVDISKQIVVIDPPPGLLEITIVNDKQKVPPPRGLLLPANDPGS